MIPDQPNDPWESGPYRPPRPVSRRDKARGPRTILHWSVLDESQILLGIAGLIGSIVLILAVMAMLPATDGCRDHSCAIGEPIGVTWIEADDTVAVQYLPCGEETITEVTISDLRTGDILWQLTATEPTTRTTFIAGQPPAPFVESVPFERLPVGKLELTMVGKDSYVLPFERSDLFGDLVFINGTRVERPEFEAQAMKVGGCADRASQVGNDNSVMLTAALVALAGATAGTLALRFIDIGSGVDG